METSIQMSDTNVTQKSEYKRECCTKQSWKLSGYTYIPASIALITAGMGALWSTSACQGWYLFSIGLKIAALSLAIFSLVGNDCVRKKTNYCDRIQFGYTIAASIVTIGLVVWGVFGNVALAPTAFHLDPTIYVTGC